MRGFNDYESNDVEGAAYYAREYFYDDDRPTPSEYEECEVDEEHLEVVGTCNSCGRTIIANRPFESDDDASRRHWQDECQSHRVSEQGQEED